VPKDRVQVSVSKGIVTLEGTVDHPFQKDAASLAIRNLAGARGVVNSLKVKQVVIPSDVRGRIEAAFRRSADIEAERVRVEVHDSKVVLRGDLHSVSEKEDAERAARAAPGVTEVENLITITPW
jgi:osmotically-inducible protein OsmY